MTVTDAELDAEIARARSILDDAITAHRPVAIFGCFSGGHDSLVSTHFTLENYRWSRALHINTGVGIEATREFVRRTCRAFGWPLVEERTPHDYEAEVLAHGFPGPGQHPLYYRRLKERCVDAVLRRAKRTHPRIARVLFVTGIRGDESRIRSGYREAVRRRKGQVWANPFYFARWDHFAAYRARFALPVNPVVMKLGMSGECLCGCFAHPGELDAIRRACPLAAARIEALERRVREAGHPWGYEDEGPPRWWTDLKRGQRTLFDLDGEVPDMDRRPMCHNCEKVVR